jgi:hypothetical protein
MSDIDQTTWPAKTPGEKVTARFDFTKDLDDGDAIESIEFVVTVLAGVDASPQNILDGLPVLKGARVFQRLQGGLADCSYLVECRASTAQGNLLILARVLPVKALLN